MFNGGLPSSGSASNRRIATIIGLGGVSIVAVATTIWMYKKRNQRGRRNGGRGSATEASQQDQAKTEQEKREEEERATDAVNATTNSDESDKRTEDNENDAVGSSSTAMANEVQQQQICQFISPAMLFFLVNHELLVFSRPFGSADSGRATGHLTSYSPFADAAAELGQQAADNLPIYEFEVPNTLVGLIIGIKGKTIKELCTRADVRMLIRPHHTQGKFDTHQLCSVEGRRDNINKSRIPIDESKNDAFVDELNIYDNSKTPIPSGECHADKSDDPSVCQILPTIYANSNPLPYSNYLLMSGFPSPFSNLAQMPSAIISSAASSPSNRRFLTIIRTCAFQNIHPIWPFLWAVTRRKRRGRGADSEGKYFRKKEFGRFCAKRWEKAVPPIRPSLSFPSPSQK
ncbi:hypothetical protein niasHT_021189 [Heterodera trifolii]|uniref:K Homology domain-containing protein n=1 Tax=Heterodera trifolii TaxID=157864 RepID=A0ABD2KRS6_9BILA